jgi:hypothetical protein
MVETRTGVYIRGIPGVDARIPGCFEDRKSLSLRSDKYRRQICNYLFFANGPTLEAIQALIWLKSYQHTPHFGSPIPIAPRMGTLTRKPEFPSCLYSTEGDMVVVNQLTVVIPTYVGREA